MYRIKELEAKLIIYEDYINTVKLILLKTNKSNLTFSNYKSNKIVPFTLRLGLI